MNWLRRHYRTIVLVCGGLGVAMWALRPRAPYLREGVYAAWVLLTILWLVLALQSWPPFMRALGRLRSWAKRRGEQGQYRIAYGTLLAAEALGARDAWSVSSRGYLADLLGRKEKAKALHRTALQVDSTEPMARGHLIQLLLDEEAIQEAASLAEPLEHLAGVDSGPILSLAWDLLDRDPSKALQLCKVAERAGNPSAKVIEAGALYQLDRPREALAIYQMLSEESSDLLLRMQGRHGIAWVYGTEGRYREALEIAESALNLGRKIPEETEDSKRHTDAVRATVEWLRQETLRG